MEEMVTHQRRPDLLRHTEENSFQDDQAGTEYKNQTNYLPNVLMQKNDTSFFLGALPGYLFRLAYTHFQIIK